MATDLPLLPSPAAPSASAEAGALRQSEARKAAILEAALDAIITIDHRGLVLEVNAATLRIFGYREEEMLGHEMAFLIVPPELREAHRRGLQHFLQTGHGPALGKRLEMPACRKGGEIFPIELAITRIPLEGEPMFTGHIRDITERKAIEAQLRTSRDEAEKANAAKAEFLARMSHALRTPLNAILGFSQILQRTPLGPVQEESLHHIAQAGEQLLSLIDEVLEMARLEDPAPAVPAPPPLPRDTPPRRILYVEEEPAHVRQMEGLLHEWAQLCTCPRREVACAAALRFQPGLILLGPGLVASGGAAVLRHLREQPGLATLPVAIVTPEGASPELEPLRALGVRACLTPPLEAEAVRTILSPLFPSPHPHP